MKREYRHTAGAYAVLAAIVAGFVVLKLYGLRPAVGDEGIYFYLGARVADGLVPYRDFVFVHPPMHVYLLGLVALVGGSSFLAMKAMPALFALVSGLALYDIARGRTLEGLLPGPWWPLVPPALLLFSYDVLRASSHWTGVSQATCFAILALAVWERGRPRLAGALAAAALGTATYVAPILAGMFLLRLPIGRRADAGGRREFRDAFLAAAITFVALHLPVWIAAPGAWWSQTIAFQLAKPPVGSTFGAAFRQLLTAEGFLVAASALWIVSCVRKRPAERAAWLPSIGLGMLAVLSGLERVYIYYFVAALPLLALGAACFLRAAVARIVELWRRSRSEAVPTLAALAPLLLALAVQPLAYRSIPEVAAAPDQVRTYAFTPTPGMGPVNTIVSALFVERRRIGFPAPGVWRYLWHEATWWEGARELAADVAAETGADGTLYGDSTTTPLLAFLADRRVACELADTNTLHFRTGFRSIEDDLACAREDGLELIVVQANRGVALLPEFRQFVEVEGSPWREAVAGNRQVTLYHWARAGAME